MFRPPSTSEVFPRLARNLLTLCVATGLLLGWTSVASAVAVRDGFDANVLPANDDGSAPDVPLGFALNFFGVEYSTVNVNNNGNVTFDAVLGSFTPFDLTSTERVIIAPFFADVDTLPCTQEEGCTSSMPVSYGVGTVDGNDAFGVNWVDVGFFSRNTSKLNSFQLVIIDRSDLAPGDFDFEFNYDQIEWETGNASGGVDGLGGSSARAGFSNGTGDSGTFFEQDGSAENGAFLDTNTVKGLIYQSLNSGIAGRLRFEVRDGTPNTTIRYPADGWGESLDIHEVQDFESASLDVDAGKIGFLAARDGGVHILDLTFPQQLEVLGKYNPETCDAGGENDIPFFADDVLFVDQPFVTFDGDTSCDESCNFTERYVMHVSAGECGVHVVDVTQPEEPFLISTYGVAENLIVESMDMYVGTDNPSSDCGAGEAVSYVAGINAFAVYDVSDPENPMFCSQLQSSDFDVDPGSVVSLAYFEEEDFDSQQLSPYSTMLVALGTDDGVRIVNVDDPIEPLEDGAVVIPTDETEGFSQYRTVQHVEVLEQGESNPISEFFDLDAEYGLISAWAAGFLVVGDGFDEIGDPLILAHEPTDSAFYGSELCALPNSEFGFAVCAAEGQVGLTRMVPEDAEGGIARVDENADEDGDQSIPVGPAGAFAWDVTIEECTAYVTWGVYSGTCTGGDFEGESCVSATQCVGAGGGVCNFPGGLDIIPLPDCEREIFAEEPPPADTDSDGVTDAEDNCVEVANDQTDSDLDGFGNACDADLNNDGAVGVPDFRLLVNAIGQSGTAADLDGDGGVGVSDFGILQGLIGTSPGPSGLECAGKIPCQ